MRWCLQFDISGLSRVGIIGKTFYCVKDISYVKHYKISYYLNMK